MLSNPHVVARNRTRRRAWHLLIGRTHGGRVLTIALAAAKTREASAWRPVTSFLSTQAQRNVLERALGNAERG